MTEIILYLIECLMKFDRLWDQMRFENAIEFENVYYRNIIAIERKRF